MGTVAALAALMIWQSYSAALRTGEAKATSSAQIVAAHLEWMLEASDQALRRIDSALGNEPIRVSAGAIADIRDAVGDLPEGFQYSVYDETGRLRLSSVPEAIGIDVSDREYFNRLEGGEAVVISPQLEERLSGEQVFVIARRIARGGAFLGAASIAIPTRRMDEFWGAMELGPNSTVAAIRTDGWLVARHPQLDRSLNFSEAAWFAEMLPRQPSGFYHSSISPADGKSRISAMVAVHEQIYESDQFDRLELSSYIKRLVTQIASTFPGDVEIEFKLDPVTVERDHGLPIGLIVNELVSNAFKYAFSNGTGHLSVQLSADAGKGRLRISDDGPGYSTKQARKGMGSKLIAGFVAQIDGTLELDTSAGTTVTIVFPSLG